MARTVLITGCSAGIGRAVAELFADRGWNVVATMRSPESAGELAGKRNVLVTALDVTDEDSIAVAVKKAEERFEAIDVLVNNAGFGLYGIIGSDLGGEYPQTVRNERRGLTGDDARRGARDAKEAVGCGRECRLDSREDDLSAGNDVQRHEVRGRRDL